MYEHPERFETLRARYHFRLAVLQPEGRGAALNQWLLRNPAWALRYEDSKALIFTLRD